MTDIYRTESETRLQEDVHEFVVRNILPFEREALRTGTVDRELLTGIRKQALNLGIHAPTIPKEFGGSERSWTEIAIVSQELGRVLPALRNALQFPPGILALASEYLAQEHVAPCAKGEKACGIAWPNGFVTPEIGTFPTSARPAGDNWTLNEGKYLIENGDTRDFLIVFAQSGRGNDGSEATAFLVSRDSPGLQISRETSVRRIDGVTLSQVEFSNCTVPHANMLGKPGEGLRLAADYLTEMRLIQSAVCLGTAERCFLTARKHAIRKRLGGRPIALKQVVQWKLADMAVHIRGLKLMLSHVARQMDERKESSRELLTLRYHASEVAGKVADMTLAILGEDGLIEDQPIARLIENARASAFGTEPSESLKFRIAREVFDSVH